MKTSEGRLSAFSEEGVWCAATVSATPKQVKDACRGWAKDMRWRAVDDGENGDCVFFLNRASWLLGNPTIQVATLRHGRLTDVEFRASLLFTNFPIWDHALTGLAENFANGVCFELARQGATVEPENLGFPCGNRRRRSIVARVFSPLYYSALVGCLPVSFLIYAVTREGLLAFTIGFWMALLLPLTAMFRYRSAGMSVKRVFFTYVFFLLIPILLLTLITAVIL
jgi:hypothetical protein